MSVMSFFMKFYCTGVGSVGGVGAGEVVSRRASTLGIALMSLSAGGVIGVFAVNQNNLARRRFGNLLMLLS